MSRRRRPRNRTRSRRRGARPLLVRLAVALVIGLVVASGVAVLGFRAWLDRYLGSEDFEHLLVRELGKLTHSEVVLGNLTRVGSSFYLDEVELRGYPEATFERVAADRLRLDLDWGGVRRGVWDIQRIEMDRLQVRVGDERLDPARRPSADSAADRDGPPAWLAARMPQRAEIGEVRVDQFSLDVVDEVQELWLRDSRVMMRPNLDAATVRLTGRGGELVMRPLTGDEDDERRMKVGEYTARLAGGAVFIDDAQLEYLGGRVTARGEISADGELDLRVNVSELNVAEVVEDDWRRRLLGRVQLESHIQGGAGDEPPRQEGRLQLADGILESLPVLDQIASYTRIDRFRRLILDTAEAEFHEQGGVLTVEKVVMESAGLLRLEGALVIEDDHLVGVFDVGVAPETLRWIPGAERRVFTERRDSPASAGFVWTTMRLTGPVEAPREDLSARLLAAATGEVIEGVTDVGRGITDGLGDAVRQAPGVGRGLLDSGRELLDDETIKDLPGRMLEGGVEGARGLLPLFRD